MWQKWFSKKELVEEVIATLREYHALLIERAEVLRHTKGLSDEEHALFNAQAKTADRVYRLLDEFTHSIINGDTQATENEQLAQIQKWINEELVREAGYHHDGKDFVKSLKAYFQRFLDQKSKAYEVFATLADDMRVKLLAVQFLLEQATHASTHRAKDARIQTIRETITTIVENLGRIDKDQPEQYFWHVRSNTGSWDYVEALRQMHYQRIELESLRQENEELKAKLAPQQELKKLTEVEIPF